MANRLKEAFGQIRAEDSLKEATLRRLREGARPRPASTVRRFSAVAACFLLLTLSGIFSYSLYFTEAAYIDLDINPSIALVINRFDRVIDASAYNGEGEDLLAALRLRHKPIKAALSEVIESTAREGLLQDLVSVTVVSTTGDEEGLMDEVRADILETASHHAAVQVDVASVDGETMQIAHDMHISPAKYLAILALQEVDPSITTDECMGHTLGELRQLAERHEEEHHGEGDCPSVHHEEGEHS